MEHKLTDAQREVALQKAREIPGFLWSEGCGFESGVVESELLDYVASVLAALPKPEPVAWLNLSKMTLSSLVYATGFKTSPAQSPVYAEAPIQSAQGWKPKELPFAILDEELSDLRRFHECVMDDEGYDVPKNRMRRLAEIGLLHHVSAGYYEHTIFGLSVLNGDFDATTTPQPAALADDARDSLLSAMQTAADQIRKCDYTPARSTLLTAIAAAKGEM